MEPALSRLPGDAAALRMVDVGHKPPTRRTATAEGSIRMSAGAFQAVSKGTLTKGDVLAASEVAGMFAAKRAAELIPLCHPWGWSTSRSAPTSTRAYRACGSRPQPERSRRRA